MTNDKPELSSVPVIHVQSENPSFTTNVILTETNYDVWSQIMEMQIAGREKLEYLTSKTSPKEIMKRYLRLPTAREIWTALAKAFYDGADESQLFALNQRAFSTKQVGCPLSTYYGEILRRDLVLDLEETYAYVRRDSVRRAALNGEPEHSEPSTMVAHRVKCYELIGYPEWWDFAKAPRKRNSKTNHHASVAVVEPSHASTSNPEKASSFIATSGNVGKALHTSVSHSEWIIDSGATNHMTFDNNHIQSIKSSDQHIVSTADGTPLSRVRRRLLAPYTPQQNGVAERKNHHLLEVVRASLFGAHMPTSYWGEAVTAAAYLINRVPSSSLQFQTPFECPSSHCLRTKLEPRALRCVFVGYALHQKGYRCYHPPSRKLYVTLDVTLHHPLDNLDFIRGDNLETSGECPSDGITMDNREECPGETGDGPEVFEDENQGQMEVQNQMEVPSVSHDVPANQLSSPADSMPESHENSESEPHLKVLPNRVTRGKPKVSYEPVLNSKSKYPINNYVSYHRLSKESMAFVNQLSVVSIPNSVQEALKDPRWKEAMNEEMKALQKNSTWEVVDLPEGKIPVGCRWVFTIKYKADGTIERCKARLVAKGYTQTYGIDYTETFAPVAKINTFRILLSLAVNLDWPLHQFDVKNAFLHGNLQEEVYMELPPGCNLQTEGNKQVCRLRKSLYGLKQSPRAWFGRFTSFMKSIGYKQSNSDHTLFLKHNEEQITALIVYVDDMIVTGNDLEERKTLQEHLAREFEMKDLGELKYFLGIEVSRSKKGIFLSQRKYALDLLNETGMTACSPASTPMEENLKLCVHSNQVPANKERYQRLVGRLMYLAHTRPDLAYALSVEREFYSQKETIWIFNGYTDADWAGSVQDRRSTSGYFTFVGGNLVTWRSKKLEVVARSSAEAEYKGMAKAICEMLWIRNLMQDLHIKQVSPMKLYCDNKAACDIAHNPVQHDRTKHVEVDRHFIKEKLEEKLIEVPHVRSQDQLADVLTKAVSNQAFNGCLDKLGMSDIYAPT
uniref:Integrase catalytic domain-containing protein n=1 Tax=Fagus sylvatica TaxID=28930 RepID=A0A2N9EG31_FAGSY